MTPRPKTEYVRSEALMKAYRLLPCQNCGRDDDTVCGAHSNWAEHGKGRGIKASDDKCASLCHVCHTALDQGPASGDLKRAMWDRAHDKTMRSLIEMSYGSHRIREILVRAGIVVG